MMSIKVLLDTNICIYLIKSRNELLLKKIMTFKPGEIGVSGISIADLEYGISKSSRIKENRAALEKFVRPMEIIDYDARAARFYGDIRIQLEKKKDSLSEAMICL